MNRISSWTIGILTLLIFGCENPSPDIKNPEKELKSGQTKEQNSPKQEFNFITAYFQMTGDTDFPEVSEKVVAKKMKQITIRLTADSIYLNDFALPIEHETPKTDFFFGRKYEYNYYKSAFQTGYNEDLGNKLSVIFADFKEDHSSEYWNYFFEGGYAILKGQNLYLNFKRYIVQFSSEPLKKKQLCELPFDMWQDWRFCEYDERESNGDFCASKFPIYMLNKDKEMKASLELLLKEEGRTLKTVHKINTPKNHPDILVVIAEAEEESSGDYFIVMRDPKNGLTILKDPKDEFLHSYNFIISKNLKVTFYENNAYSPKKDIKCEFQILSDGTYSKL